MAKGQQRSNREKKKPKQDKNKKGASKVSQVSESFARASAKKPPAPAKS